MMKKYAYIGKYWYNPGSWSTGGCIYFNYIRQYMSTGRQSTVNSVCNSSNHCDTSGGVCTGTTDEDQTAYATWQVANKMGPISTRQAFLILWRRRRLRVLLPAPDVPGCARCLNCTILHKKALWQLRDIRISWLFLLPPGILP